MGLRSDIFFSVFFCFCISRIFCCLKYCCFCLVEGFEPKGQSNDETCCFSVEHMCLFDFPWFFLKIFVVCFVEGLSRTGHLTMKTVSTSRSHVNHD